MKEYEFIVIHITDGCFIKKSGYWSETYQLNGGDFQPENTFLSDWLYYPGMKTLESMQIKGRDTHETVGWTLKSPQIECGDIPLNLPLEDLGYDCDDGEWVGPRADIGMLYTRRQETTEGVYEKAVFKIKQSLSYDVPHMPPVDFSVFKDGNVPKPTVSTVTDLLYPGIITQYKPCWLSSEETFKIVSHHVKRNYDPSLAEITSDYDFCFAVQKIYKQTPVSWSKEVKKANGKSYARPRFNTGTIKQQKVKLFEMTHKNRDYAGYTAIEGFKGDSQEDLKQNIEAYLEELMNYINMPLHVCENCAGVGSLLVEKFDSNKR